MNKGDDFYLYTGFGLLLVVTSIIYYPALSSGFQLDDINNLGALSAIPENGILSYILGGSSGPSGRPISLLTFALQHHAWPENSFSFKAVNLAIHLLCGWLILIICRKIAGYLDFNAHERSLFILTVTAFWLLHPIQITTVLYVIQRMTQLSALFTLVGIAFYLHLFERYSETGKFKNLLGIAIAIWGCTILGVLSKENGILLPLYILIINQTLFVNRQKDTLLRLCNWIIVGLPLIALLIYLSVNFDVIQSNYRIRDFTMSERLMTEAVILLEYLQKIIIPYPGTFSIYHDDFPVSHGLLSPPWTLVSLVVIAALLLTTLVWRKKYLLPALGILWYFGGHILESTYLHLELYFEHRNYLPSLGIFIVIAYLAITSARYLPRRWMMYGIVSIYFIWLVTISFLETSLWSKPLERQQHLVENHPDSTRALTALGNELISRHKIKEARNFFDELKEKYPDDIYPYIKIMAIKGCVTKQKISNAEWQELVTRAAMSEKSGFGVVEELALVVSAAGENDCGSLDLNNLTRLIVTLAFNPEYKSDQAALHELAARSGIIIKDANVAYHNILAATSISPTIPRLILKLQILIALDKRIEAGNVLADLQRRIDANPRLGFIYSGRVENLKNLLDK